VENGDRIFEACGDIFKDFFDGSGRDIFKGLSNTAFGSKLNGFVERGYYKKSLPIIAAIKNVLDSVDGAISTRQMYYQLLSVGVIQPTSSGYHKVQRLLVQLRRDGIVNPNRICDRTRNKHQRPSWNGLHDILDTCKIQYRRDYWSDQDVALFISVEKQALEGIFAEVCDDYGVGLFVLRGYPSYTLLYDWAGEIIELSGMGKKVKIYYFGDFDATGVHIDESVTSQLFEFRAKFTFERVGILPGDIEKFNLMTLPVKRSDTRAKRFIGKYGTKCVELDALPPNELKQRIQKVIIKNIDLQRWERIEEIEKQEQITLENFIDGLDE